MSRPGDQQMPTTLTKLVSTSFTSGVFIGAAGLLYIYEHKHRLTRPEDGWMYVFFLVLAAMNGYLARYYFKRVRESGEQVERD